MAKAPKNFAKNKINPKNHPKKALADAKRKKKEKESAKPNKSFRDMYSPGHDDIGVTPENIFSPRIQKEVQEHQDMLVSGSIAPTWSPDNEDNCILFHFPKKFFNTVVHWDPDGNITYGGMFKLLSRKYNYLRGVLDMSDYTDIKNKFKALSKGKETPRVGGYYTSVVVGSACKLAWILCVGPETQPQDNNDGMKKLSDICRENGVGSDLYSDVALPFLNYLACYFDPDDELTTALMPNQKGLSAPEDFNLGRFPTTHIQKIQDHGLYTFEGIEKANEIKDLRRHNDPHKILCGFNASYIIHMEWICPGLLAAANKIIANQETTYLTQENVNAIRSLARGQIKTVGRRPGRDAAVVESHIDIFKERMKVMEKGFGEGVCEVAQLHVAWKEIACETLPLELDDISDDETLLDSDTLLEQDQKTTRNQTRKRMREEAKASAMGEEKKMRALEEAATLKKEYKDADNNYKIAQMVSDRSAKKASDLAKTADDLEVKATAAKKALEEIDNTDTAAKATAKEKADNAQKEYLDAKAAEEAAETKAKDDVDKAKDAKQFLTNAKEAADKAAASIDFSESDDNDE